MSPSPEASAACRSRDAGGIARPTKAPTLVSEYELEKAPLLGAVAGADALEMAPLLDGPSQEGALPTPPASSAPSLVLAVQQPPVVDVLEQQ